MKIYLVGGAVRDELLGRKVTEKDWVVTGATPSMLLEQGYTQVGKDFPVFLHPHTRDEYALARLERKTGSGYTGFDCDASPSVTLEEDLQRRDLTINAMARAQDGTLVDPYHGQQDLTNRVLRHVSPAFSEDPLRIFRVARFASRYHYLGFRVAPETQTLMQQMARTGMLKELTAERVWMETRRAVMQSDPDVYFTALKEAGGLSGWFCELITGLPEHLARLKQAAASSVSLEVRMASLLCGLSADDTQALCQRLKCPNSVTDLAVFASRFAHSLSGRPGADELLEIFNRTDAWRKPKRFAQLLEVVDIKNQVEQTSWPQTQILGALEAARNIDVQKIIAGGARGPQIKTALDEQRHAAVAQILLKTG
ncbi:CCA tRNA nucleotidyltransferase [Salinimonas lutimaris]|uniref:CCA tRNA nucleotidyltransferase n=1 Tax=Salinimonas lutimaris TaxID=914153 RepID=UPI0010C143CC|nr:CCA tRNA nucleotidyltransferase [Salinimonas lutimaris]